MMCELKNPSAGAYLVVDAHITAVPIVSLENFYAAALQAIYQTIFDYEMGIPMLHALLFLYLSCFHTFSKGFTKLNQAKTNNNQNVDINISLVVIRLT